MKAIVIRRVGTRPRTAARLRGVQNILAANRNRSAVLKSRRLSSAVSEQYVRSRCRSFRGIITNIGESEAAKSGTHNNGLVPLSRLRMVVELCAAERTRASLFVA